MKIFNYTQFVNECILNEALNVKTTEQGNKKVNIFVGRFQPFTLGHVKVFEQMYNENGLPTVVLLVRGKKQDFEKSPFDEDTQMTMFSKMQKEYPFLEAVYVIEYAAIDLIFNTLRPAYEPVLWGFGTDRKKPYEQQINKESYRNDLNVLPEFAGFEIKRSDEDISASKVRNALKIDDEETYKKMTPKSLHDMYDVLMNIVNNNQ